MKVILASQSPRRQDLLAQMGVKFTAIPSRFDERLDDARSPEAVAAELALGKAIDVARDHPGAIVIGSDTIVTVDGHQLAKPATPDEAHAMLRDLAGRDHAVTTGLAVVRLADHTQLTGAETSWVHFRPYDAASVQRYVDSGDPLDKAGAYGVQSGAAPLISHIQGNYDTVVGLPTRLLAEFLGQLRVKAHALELPPPVKQIPLRIIHRDIVSAFIFSSDNQLLMGKGGVYGGTWLIPGGGVESRETKLDALRREVHEEVGININGHNVKPIPVDITGESQKTLRHTGERVLVKMKFFNYEVRLPQPAADIQVTAGDDFTDAQWFPVTDLPGMELSPPSVTTLKKLGYL